MADGRGREGLGSTTGDDRPADGSVHAGGGEQLAAPEDDTRLYERGNVVWHSSDGESGPDCGISVGLDGQRMLYAGELPGRNRFGWGLKVYGLREGDTFEIAKQVVDNDEARVFIEMLGRLLTPAPNNTQPSNH